MGVEKLQKKNVLLSIVLLYSYFQISSQQQLRTAAFGSQGRVKLKSVRPHFSPPWEGVDEIISPVQLSIFLSTPSFRIVET